MLEAAAGHGAAFLQQFAIEGYGPGAPQFAAGAGQVAEHQGVAKDVAEHLAVDGLMAHQLHGPTDQTLAAGRAPGARAPFEGGAGAGTAPTAAAADFVQGQEGEPAGAAALEQLDRPGSDAVVIDHHLAKPGTGGHF